MNAHPLKHDVPGHRPGTTHGETIAAGDVGVDDRSGRAPLPHEQDESSHSQASAAEGHRRVGGQAYADTMEGRQDTDRGPVMDEVYHRMASTGRGGEAPRR
ncbi:MAG TPA: hypothetical protein VF453_13025 [Burkholderiaceae bacterium]